MPIISTRHVLGIAAVVALVLFQQVLQEVTQYQVATTHYVQPSFTIWLNHGFLVVFLPLALLARCMRHCTERRADAKARAQPLVNEDAAEEEDEEGAALEAVESAVRSAKTCSLCALFNDAREREGWGTRTRVALRAVALAVLYLVPNVLWVYTLTQVTITMFMVITQSVCVFVLLFEAAMHRTFPHPLDLLAVAGVISGVIAIALAEEHKTSSANSVSGVVNCVVVSLGFALYEVYWTHSVGSDATRPALEAVFLMVGLVGAANVALLWPAFWTFDALRATSLVDGAALPGPFALPSSGEEWALSLSGASLAAVFNCCFMGGLALTSALFVSVGSVLAVPLAIVVDRITRQTTLNLGEVGGIALILLGFAVVTSRKPLEAALLSAWRKWRARRGEGARVIL